MGVLSPEEKALIKILLMRIERAQQAVLAHTQFRDDLIDTLNQVINLLKKHYGVEGEFSIERLDFEQPRPVGEHRQGGGEEIHSSGNAGA